MRSGQNGSLKQGIGPRITAFRPADNADHKLNCSDIHHLARIFSASLAAVFSIKDLLHGEMS
jgi:hypothetical protein